MNCDESVFHSVKCCNYDERGRARACSLCRVSKRDALDRAQQKSLPLHYIVVGVRLKCTGARPNALSHLLNLNVSGRSMLLLSFLFVFFSLFPFLFWFFISYFDQANASCLLWWWWVNRQRATFCMYKLIAITFHSSCHYCHHVVSVCEMWYYYRALICGFGHKKKATARRHIMLSHIIHSARISHNAHESKPNKSTSEDGQNWWNHLQDAGR